MPQDELKKRLRQWIIYAVVAAHICLVMLIGAAMARASQLILQMWVAGIVGGIVVATLLGAWRAMLSANESYEITMTATGSKSKARAIWAGQGITLSILVLHFFDIVKFPGEIFLAAVVVFIGLGVWSRLQGEWALRDALAADKPHDNGPSDNSTQVGERNPVQTARQAAPAKHFLPATSSATRTIAADTALKRPAKNATGATPSRTFGRRV